MDRLDAHEGHLPEPEAMLFKEDGLIETLGNE